MSTLLDLHTDFAYWNPDIARTTPGGSETRAGGGARWPAGRSTAGGS